MAAAVSAYYRVLQTEERLRFARERKTLADEMLRIARERHLSGDAAKFEVNLAQTEVARTESDISAAQGRVALARSTLAKALGFSSGTDIQVVGNLKERSLFDTIRSTQAPGEGGDLQAARAEVEASRAAISLAEAERLSLQRGICCHMAAKPAHIPRLRWDFPRCLWIGEIPDSVCDMLKISY